MIEYGLKEEKSSLEENENEEMWKILRDFARVSFIGSFTERRRKGEGKECKKSKGKTTARVVIKFNGRCHV